jgi:hypothetical protein
MSNHFDKQLDIIQPLLLEQIEDDARQLLQQRFQARSFGVHAFRIAGFDESDRGAGIVGDLHDDQASAHRLFCPGVV